MLRQALSELRFHPSRFVATLIAIAISVGFMTAISVFIATEQAGTGKANAMALSQADLVLVSPESQVPADLADDIGGLRRKPGHFARRVVKRKEGSRAAPLRGSRIGDQNMYWPPLTASVEPVMKAASSEARNSTVRAISSGLPRRPTGMCGRIFALSTSSGIAATISVPM